MQGSIERVRAMIDGELPDRAPLYELLRNDAVIPIEILAGMDVADIHRDTQTSF
jgi:hypothetical protein